MMNSVFRSQRKSVSTSAELVSRNAGVLNQLISNNDALKDILKIIQEHETFADNQELLHQLSNAEMHLDMVGLFLRELKKAGK